MKKIIIAVMLLSAGVLSAQNVKPKHEIQDQMVKSTYYYDNGQVKQEGFYKNGKLHGNWTAYNEDGTKQSMGEYNNGMKTGKWLFWTGSVLNEVDYADSRIAEVKKWSKDAIVSNK
ncbi:membrane-binding protein [Flavobacterium album]|uniref:Membrane-binding protein n=1 Tax=Flavobacterium album TaxID=2175091 RepID=A0A2S1QUX3_9FLAO|nr:membrane-binding protein [Flavobacterium album]AWH84129.1 membrane-binding protein [Flavobacterium album]